MPLSLLIRGVKPAHFSHEGVAAWGDWYNVRLPLQAYPGTAVLRREQQAAWAIDISRNGPGSDR